VSPNYQNWTKAYSTGEWNAVTKRLYIR